MIQLNKRIIGAVAIVVVFMLLALVGNSIALEISRGQSLVQEDRCAIAVEVEGSGVVRIEQANHESRAVRSANVQLDCEQVVTLIAQPSGPWRFEGWRGIEASASEHSEIDISAPAVLTAVFSPRKITYIPAEAPYYDRSGKLVDTIAVYEPIWKAADVHASESSQADAPVVDAWYGDPQPFGRPGVAQQYFDVLGTATDSDMDLSAMEYSLNGDEPVALSYGGDGSVADGRRLWNAGDFVVDLSLGDLQIGNNIVTITATDSISNTGTLDVVVNYDPSAGWPLPSDVVWDSAGSQDEKLLEVSQVVDGKWNIVADGVRTAETGYDRLLDVGDIGWTSYEAVVPITIYGYSDEGFAKPVQYAPALGLMVHWQGHTDSPASVPCIQPKCGWLPIGMANWYEWKQDESGDAQFSMWAHHNQRELAPGEQMLDLGTTYYWKVRVDNAEGTYGMYRFKVWEKGQPEPNLWLMEKAGTVESRQAGSLLLLAHHVDVAFGIIKLRNLNGDIDPPTISSVQIDVNESEATVSWQTDEPATSKVEYYDIPGNEMVVSDDTLVTDHSVLLENLTADTTYEVKIYSEDGSGNLAGPVLDSFRTDPPLPETYELTVSVVGPGSVNVVPLKPEYDSGDQVLLTAVPKWPKWYLSGWLINGQDQGDSNPKTVVITEDTTVQAAFLRYQFVFMPMVVAGNP